MTEHVCQEMTRALAGIQPLRQSKDPVLSHHNGHAGEYDPYLGSLITHPKMVIKVRSNAILGLFENRKPWIIGQDHRVQKYEKFDRPPWLPFLSCDVPS